LILLPGSLTGRSGDNYRHLLRDNVLTGYVSRNKDFIGLRHLRKGNDMKGAMIVMAMVMTTGVLYGEATGQTPSTPAEEQPEVLTRGPVNEAFA
jgi:hypothetical protein